MHFIIQYLFFECYNYINNKILINNNLSFPPIISTRFHISQEFTTQDFKEISNELFENSASGLNFFYSSFTLLMDAITSLVFRDMSLILGSLVFIICFLMFQTGSFWISLWAVFSIITGFLGANLVYRVILDMRYFGIFHVLAIFILLCIGADDVFVFYDTWKMSAHFRYPSLAHRLSDTYRKAAGAMMFTSLTTAVAFAVSASSPLLSVSTFGIFSALLIIVNYISVVVFFPTVVISYHLFWEKYRCCCCCSASGSSVADMQREVEEQPPVVLNNRTLSRSFSNKPSVSWLALVLNFYEHSRCNDYVTSSRNFFFVSKLQQSNKLHYTVCPLE